MLSNSRGYVRLLLLGEPSSRHVTSYPVVVFLK